MSSSTTERWAALDFGPPADDVEETEDPVLLDFPDGDQVAVVTLNRPHADNAITTEMGALLTEVVEEIAVRTAVRVVVLTGAGLRTCRRSSSPAAVSTCSPPACGRCSGWRSSSHE